MYLALSVIVVSIVIGAGLALSFSSIKLNSPYGGCSTYPVSEPPTACLQLVPYLVLVAVVLIIITIATFTLQIQRKPRRKQT